MQCKRVRHTEAVRRCKNKGGLAANYYFPRVDVTLSNNGRPRGFVLYSQLKNPYLENGESAWMAGYVKYGALWNHWGCYLYDDIKYTIHSSSENKDNGGFYQCSLYCENEFRMFNRRFFFATNTTSCCCFNEQHDEEIKGYPNNSENNQPFELYRNRRRFSEHGVYQCSSVEYTDEGDWVETTSKCLGRK